MKKGILLLAAVVIVFSFTSCGTSKSAESAKAKTVKSQDVSKPDDDLSSVIDDKIKNINDRKIDKYLSLYTSDTDTYNIEKLDKTNSFKQYQVKCSAENEKVINKTKNTAQVQYVIKSVKVKGPGFLDNKTLIVDNMKKVKGDWKIDKEDIIKVEYNDPVYDAVYKNIKALNEKDITAYMDTIDKTDIDNFNNYRDQQLDSFDKYDLTYNLQSADITSRSDSDTQVNFSETIIKNDNSDFKDNTTSGIIHLKKSGNNWKIFKIDIKKTENLKK